MQREKCFRKLAPVYVDAETLAKKLIKTGLARVYVGGKRTGWCNELNKSQLVTNLLL